MLICHTEIQTGFYFILESAYTIGRLNTKCSDGAVTQIITKLSECKAAVRQLNGHSYNLDVPEQESTATWPYGCYRLKDKSEVYFNRNKRVHRVRNRNARPICIEGNKIRAFLYIPDNSNT